MKNIKGRFVNNSILHELLSRYASKIKTIYFSVVLLHKRCHSKPRKLKAKYLYSKT